jgi:hypothetical protein
VMRVDAVAAAAIARIPRPCKTASRPEIPEVSAEFCWPVANLCCPHRTQEQIEPRLDADKIDPPAADGHFRKASRAFSIRGASEIAQTVIDLGLAMSSNPGKDLQLSSVVTVMNTIAESPDASHILGGNRQNQLRRAAFPNFVLTTLITVTDDD